MSPLGIEPASLGFPIGHLDRVSKTNQLDTMSMTKSYLNDWISGNVQIWNVSATEKKEETQT